MAADNPNKSSSQGNANPDAALWEGVMNSAEYHPTAKKYQEEKLSNIEEMEKKGTLNSEQADRFRERIEKRASRMSEDLVNLQKRLGQMEQGNRDEFEGESEEGKRKRGVFEIMPHQKGETSRQYGDRVSDIYNRNVIGQYLKRNMDGKEPESQQDYMKRIREFYAAHPRHMDEKESLEAYDRRIAKLFEKGEPAPGNPTPQPEPDPNRNPGPVIDKTPQLPGPVVGEIPQLPGPTKIEIGDINIKGVEITFKEIDKRKLEEAEKNLSDLRPQIAELYAKNRRLIVGGKNRAEFERVKGEYGKIMDQYLRLKTGETFEKEKHALGEQLEQKLDELKADIEAKLTEFSKSEIGGPYRTQKEVDAEKARLVEEAEATVKEWFDKEYEGIKTKVNVEFLDEFIKQEADLESATTNALDNGSFCRKVVSKVLNNRVLKGILVASSVAGLAVTGVGIATGLAAGTMAVGLSYTGAGVALGATKGGLGAALMSRQDSRVSKVRGFARQEDIAKQISEIDITKENADVRGVSNWLMEQYSQANRQDYSSNRKRTAVSAGIGAILGGLASGLHFDKTIEQTSYKTEIVDHTPVEYKPQYGAENVDVAPNHGYLQIFKQVGGDPTNTAKWDEAFKITEQIAQKYGVTSDMGKGVISRTGVPELLPGKPSTWDATSQQFLNDILNAWAANGCIPGVQTGGEAIWGTVPTIVPTIIKNSIWGYLTRATAGVTGAAIGGAIGGAGRRDNSIEINRPVPISEPESPNPEPESSSPEASSPTPESSSEAAPESPENTSASSERLEVNGFAEIYNNLPEGTTDEDARLIIISGLAKNLSYPGNFNPGDDIEASLLNLSEEQRDHLEALYNQVIAEAAARRAANQPESAPEPVNSNSTPEAPTSTAEAAPAAGETSLPADVVARIRNILNRYPEVERAIRNGEI